MLKSKFKQYNLDQSPFYCLQSKRKLAILLTIDLSKLRKLTQSDNLYIEQNKVDSKRGKIRLIQEPKPELKRVQKRIERLLKKIKLPDFIHSPAKRRSYITNAQSHINAPVVRRLDIKEFFSSTQSKHIYWFFHGQMKCSPDVADALTKLLTFKNCLPTGSPSSPILSYFGYTTMWKAISEIVQDASCTITVYMDDVTISGKNVPDKIIWQIKKQFYRYGLRDNKNKEKQYPRKSVRAVTGIIIKDGRLKVPNRQHKKMYDTRKQICKEADLVKQKELYQRLEGLDSQAKQILKANL